MKEKEFANNAKTRSQADLEKAEEIRAQAILRRKEELPDARSPAPCLQRKSPKRSWSRRCVRKSTKCVKKNGASSRKSVAARMHWISKSSFCKSAKRILRSANRAVKVEKLTEAMTKNKKAFVAAAGPNLLKTGMKIVKANERLEKIEGSRNTRCLRHFFMQIRTSLACVFVGFLIATAIADSDRCALRTQRCIYGSDVAIDFACSSRCRQSFGCRLCSSLSEGIQDARVQKATGLGCRRRPFLASAVTVALVLALADTCQHGLGRGVD